LKVCKQMFMGTFGIGEKQVEGWIRSHDDKGIPKISSPRATLGIGNPGTELAVQFLKLLPKMPSHYRRQQSTKMYLEPIYNSKRHLYGVYGEYCKDQSQKPVSRCTFHKIFDEQNLALFQPKNDQCDICCGFNAGNVSEGDWQEHTLRKDRARSEKSSDKVLASNEEFYVLTMDLESVKLAPMLKASALYYKTKLCVHNFTVYNLGSHHASCYWWNECEGELTASTFASCLIDYLNENCPLDLPVIIYSDGCTAQNRNSIMANALIHFAINQKRTIVQKYLEKGHTQMECDSVHSAVETKLKNRAIHLPSDYSTICTEARTKPFPYNSKYITHEFFRDYAEKTLTRYDSIRPGKKAGDEVVTHIRALKYNPSGIIEFKLDFDEDWQELPRRPKQVVAKAFPALYDARLPLTARKWKDLQDLKSVLPNDCHTFYDGLPHQ